MNLPDPSMFFHRGEPLAWLVFVVFILGFFIFILTRPPEDGDKK